MNRTDMLFVQVKKDKQSTANLISMSWRRPLTDMNSEFSEITLADMFEERLCNEIIRARVWLQSQ